MSHLRVFVPGCALVLAWCAGTARAGEVVAAPVCRSCAPAPVSYYGAPVPTYQARACCCNPCKPVGPVRRALRRVFHPCRPAPCCPPPVVAVPVAPVMMPPPFVPPPTPVMVAPPVDLGRPVPPPPGFAPGPPPPMPPTTGSSYQRLAPIPSPAVRVERIAAGPAGANAVQGRAVSYSTFDAEPYRAAKGTVDGR